MTGPKGNSVTNFTVPQGTSHHVICYIAKRLGQTSGETLEISAFLGGNSDLFPV